MIGLRRRAQPLGSRGEDLAVRTLKRAGYKILERNAHLGRYEIDIIARQGDTVAFVEVKTRRSQDHALPEDNVTSEKRRRIVHAAQLYLSRRQDPSLYYRFDVVTVLLPEKGKPTVTLYRDAFQAE